MTHKHDKRPWFRDYNLADNLSSLRSLQRRCWMSNEQCAEFLGVSLCTYRRWLKGKAPAWRAC